MPLPASNRNTHAPEQQAHLQARFSVEARTGLREQPDGGIFLDASRIELGDDAIAMALIADLAGVDGGRNYGFSATSSAASVISRYRDVIIESLGARDVVWIELDSMGCFDHVVHHTEGGVEGMDWRPLLSGMHAGRTEADFTALFGHVAERAMVNVRRAASMSNDS